MSINVYLCVCKENESSYFTAHSFKIITYFRISRTCELPPYLICMLRSIVIIETYESILSIHYSEGHNLNLMKIHIY
jgi:hypothetical protein